MTKPTLSVADKLTKAKIMAMREYPFFGMLVMSCEFVEDESCNTMWADGLRIGYSPRFVSLLPVGQIAWSIMHEAMHNAFGHIRRRGARHPRLHNQATDYWINNHLFRAMQKNRNTQLQEADLGIIFTEGTTICRDEHRFSEETSSDEIYAILVRELYDKNVSLRDLDADDFDDSEFGGDLNYEEAKARGVDQDNNVIGGGLDTFWKGRVASAAAAAKRQGHLPAGFERFVTELITPVVPWQEQLQQYVQPSPADFVFTQPDRRFPDADFILPSTDGKRLTAVGVFDTSGSVSDDDLKLYSSELFAIFRSFDEVDGWFISCDARVHSFEKLDQSNPIPKKIGGGGGTSFKPPFNKLQAEGITPDVLVYFTDGYGDFPTEEPRFPVIWVMVNSTVEPPFGHAIYVKT